MSYTYKEKEILMQNYLNDYKTPSGFRSSFKGVPYGMYGLLKPYIDYTKYYVVFRGPRNRGDSSTRKRNAKAFDIYRFSDRDMQRNRIEKEAFNRGVQWANNRSH
jgi:hypothetical protein